MMQIRIIGHAGVMDGIHVKIQPPLSSLAGVHGRI